MFPEFNNGLKLTRKYLQTKNHQGPISMLGSRLIVEIYQYLKEHGSPEEAKEASDGAQTTANSRRPGRFRRAFYRFMSKLWVLSASTFHEDQVSPWQLSEAGREDRKRQEQLKAGYRRRLINESQYRRKLEEINVRKKARMREELDAASEALKESLE